jgi:hypothetical protein
MTTMTKQLRLMCSNADVSEWIDWAFHQTRPQVVRIGDEDTTDVRPPLNDVSSSDQTMIETPDEHRRTLPTVPSERPTERHRSQETQEPMPPPRASPSSLPRPANGSPPTVINLAAPSPNPSVARVPPLPSQPPATRRVADAEPTDVSPLLARTLLGQSAFSQSPQSPQSPQSRPPPEPATLPMGMSRVPPEPATLPMGTLGVRSVGSRPPASPSQPPAPSAAVTTPRAEPRAPAPAPAQRPAQRSRAWIILIVLVVLALAGAAAYWALVLA